MLFSGMSHDTRIRRLVVPLLILCEAPLLSLLFPFNVYWIPLLWATSAVPVGALLTLSFWVGMGQRSPLIRLIWGTLGATYVAACSAAPELLNCVISSDDISLGSPRDYLLRVPPYIAVVAIFGGMFMLIGRYWRLVVAADRDSTVTSKSQFSILNLLLLTAAAAILMAMIRESRSAANVQSFYGMIVTTVLGFSIYFCNTACAAFAALSPTPIKRNCALVICVSALLGIAISLASGQDRIGWWLVAGGSLISIVPTAVVLVSLLCVRSAGYRLIREAVVDSDASSFTTEVSPMV